MYRVPDLRPNRSFLSEISPPIADAATEESISEEEAAEDDEDDEDEGRMIELVRAAYKYLRANVDMEQFHKSVGYQLVLAQLQAWTGKVLQAFRWKQDSPELLLFCLALAIQIGKRKYNTIHGPGQPRKDGGQSVFGLDNHALAVPTWDTLAAYIPRTQEKPGFAARANLDELDEQWQQKMGDLPKVLVLVIDGALIRLMLAFCKRSWRFLGLCDDEQPTDTEIRECQLVGKDRYATQVVQMMGQSPNAAIQLELGFQFMSKSLDAAELARSIFEAIQRLEQRGYLIIGLIGDGEGVIIKTRSEVKTLMTTGLRRQDVFLDIYCEEHLWKILRNALLKLAELFSGGWYFNMQTLGRLAFSDVSEIRQLFIHLSKHLVYTDDKMNTMHATVTLSMETVKGVREVLRRMEQESLTLPDVDLEPLKKLLEYVTKMEYWRTVFKDNAALHHAIAAGQDLLDYLERNLADIAEARAETDTGRGGVSAPTVRANAVSLVALNGVRGNLAALQEFENLVQTDERLQPYAGRIIMSKFWNQNCGELTFCLERWKNRFTNAVLYTRNSDARRLVRQIENSGTFPIARRRDTSTSYAFDADEVKTTVTLERHAKRRRVTVGGPGAEAAPVGATQCTPEQIKAFTDVNHANRKEFGQIWNVRDQRATKADAGTLRGLGKNSAGMEADAGPDDKLGCRAVGCQQPLAFTTVCDSTGRFIPNIGHGTAKSKTRLPDTVMVCCEGTGCNYSTHLFHLGLTLNSNARRPAELAIRRNHAWYCPRCSNSARVQKARSDGSDSEDAE